MCGRFVLSDASWAAYHAALSIIQPVASEVSFNIKPTQYVPVVSGSSDTLQSSLARWWFVPHWHKGDVKTWKQTTFNARIETAHEKPSFRTAWSSNRCLIPASGYYEWTGEKGRKQPHFIAPEQNIPVFFFAGLRSVLADGTQTCTIITRAADDSIAHLHSRMPVILSNEQIIHWLDHVDSTEHIQASYGTQWVFNHHRVAKFGTHDDGPELIERDGFDL